VNSLTIHCVDFVSLFFVFIVFAAAHKQQDAHHDDHRGDNGDTHGYDDYVHQWERLMGGI